MIYENQAVALIVQLQSGSGTMSWQHGAEERQGREDRSGALCTIISLSLYFIFSSPLLSFLHSLAASSVSLPFHLPFAKASGKVRCTFGIPVVY